MPFAAALPPARGVGDRPGHPRPDALRCLRATDHGLLSSCAVRCTSTFVPGRPGLRQVDMAVELERHKVLRVDVRHARGRLAPEVTAP